MDLENVGNFMYYKCRSLLACDSGGTVYDTSKRLEGSPCNSNLVSCTGKSQNEPNQLENIVYIVNREKEYRKEAVSLVDSTTHLDDDKFNDYEMNSILSYEPENEVTQYVASEMKYPCLDPKEREYSCNNDFNYQPIENNNFQYENNNFQYQNNNFQYENNNFQYENNNFQYVQGLVQQILNSNNSADTQYCEYSQLSDNLSSVKLNEGISNEVASNDSSINRNIFQRHQENNFFSPLFQYQSDSIEFSSSSSQSINEYDYDSSLRTGIESNQRHMHKRKQIYNVKDDSLTELIDESKNTLTKEFVNDFSNKIKKKKPVYNKENQETKMQYHKKNPFANLKMNSILKGSKKQSTKKVKNHFKQQKQETIVHSNDANFEPSSFNMEIMEHKRFYQADNLSNCNSRDDVLQEINAVIKLNTDLTDADYLEYVQPRERIIESDMDKLLSPTVDVEFSEMLKTCKITQIKIKEQKSQIDFNGNEVDFQNNQKDNVSKSVLSPNEIVERELFLKSAYAKKLGYENCFNTSNDSVINDILFDRTLSYEEVKLDIDFVKSVEIFTNNNYFFSKPVKQVSCTLLESLNEFSRFGGFVEEDWKDDKSSYAEEDSGVLVIDESTSFSESDKFEKDAHLTIIQEQQEQEIHPNLISSTPNKPNSFDLNLQLKYNLPECLRSTDINSKSSASLKIKIKRINDECNQYFIDDTNGQNVKTEIPAKNIDK